MKIGLFLFSQTGHTQAFGCQIEQRLGHHGYRVFWHFLSPETPFGLNSALIALKHYPSVDGFDILLLGTPVHGGRMSAPMRAFLEHVDTLEGKRVVLFSTHFFWDKWGASQTHDSMKKLCEMKGAQVLGSVSVRWLNLFRNKHIQKAVSSILDWI